MYVSVCRKEGVEGEAEVNVHDIGEGGGGGGGGMGGGGGGGPF